MARIVCFCLLSLVLFAGPARTAPAAEPSAAETIALPQDVEQALHDVLDAARTKTDPGQSSLDALTAFCLANGTGTGSRVLPERPEGAGVFHHRPLPFSLADLMAYALNPDIPGEALYPNSVRRNAWRKESPVLTAWKNLAQSPLPPAATLFARGTEFEETTPDATSGSYYAYELQRLFALAPLPGGQGTSLFMVSIQPEQSGPGLKGAVIGQDMYWNYVYTGVQGSTLPMVGWAETHIYGAATVNVWIEKEGALTLCAFKWLKAGWSGMNVVKAGHIDAGISRYLIGLAQVLGSERRPAPAAIAAYARELRNMSDEDLLAALKPYGEQLALLAGAQDLDGGDFVEVLHDGGYAQSLNREDRIAELIKQYMKDQLGMVTPSPLS